MDVLEQYFNATAGLLNEVKQQGMTLDIGSRSAVELQNIIKDLSLPNEQADQIRLAYIKLSRKIESELKSLHVRKMYPDPYCGTDCKFQLMEKISKIHKEILINRGTDIPKFSLLGTCRAWRDKGLFDFVTDQQNYLRSAKFVHMWDAVQCFEMQRYLIVQLFEYLYKIEDF